MVAGDNATERRDWNGEARRRCAGEGRPALSACQLTGPDPMVFTVTDSPAPPFRRWPKRLWILLRWTIYLLGALWAFGAVWADGPLPMDGNLILASAWGLVTLTYLCCLHSPAKRGAAWLACILFVAVPWSLKQPSNERTWAPEWGKTGRVDIEGDTVTFHHLRNFGWQPDGSFTERWETRTVRLSQLRGIDYFHNPFAGDFMAHPILSYDFGPDGRVALSVETRREVGEEFSLVGGLYKQAELQYLFGNERDFIRTRTNVRDEPIHLYRADFTAERIRASFLESVAAQNRLAACPTFYNILTRNCTTSLWTQKAAGQRQPFDHRILFNGRLDELIYERGGIVTGGLPFPELRRQALINEAALAAHDDPEFSERIRAGRVGFGTED